MKIIPYLSGEQNKETFNFKSKKKRERERDREIERERENLLREKSL